MKRSLRLSIINYELSYRGWVGEEEERSWNVSRNASKLSRQEKKMVDWTRMTVEVD